MQWSYTFGEFSEYVFVELNNLSRRSAKIDIVCDLYPEGIDSNRKTYWCSIKF